MSTFQNAGYNRAITLTETGHMEITDIYKNMKTKFSRLLVGFGTAQIIIGILCIIINGVTLGKFLQYFYPSTSYFGSGFWTGVMFIVTGAFGVAAGKGKKKCLVVSFNVLCIISGSLCLYLFIISVISIFLSQYGCRPRYDPSANIYRDDTPACRSEADVGFALETVLAILAFMEAGFAIGSSVVCCTIGACCCDCDCGCCCPPTIPRYTMLDNGEQPTRMTDQPQPTGMTYQQPATIFLYPQQPTYMPGANQMTMPGANQMTIPTGQQQPVILLNPNQLVAQYNPQQVSASSNFQNPENTGPHLYEQLFDLQKQPNRKAPPTDH